MLDVLVKTGFSILLVGGVTISSVAHAFDFAVMPDYSVTETERLFQPMVNHLSKVSGYPIKLKTYQNYIDYWSDMRKGKFDFALDAAHFVDYRVKKQSNQVLARLKRPVSFSIVTTDNNPLLYASDLVGYSIGSLPPPHRGNLEIQTFFKNPIRQPRIVEVKSYQEGIAKLREGKVEALMIPSPMAKATKGLHVVEATKAWPPLGVTASEHVPPKVKEAIGRALLTLADNDRGTAALSRSKLGGFVVAKPSEYDGYHKRLQSYGRF